MDNLPARPSFASKRFHMALCGLLLSLLPIFASAAATQDIGAIRKAVDSFVRQNTAGQSGEMELTVGAIDPRLRLPACDAPEVFLPTGSRLWGNATVGVRCQGATPWTIYVPVSVKVMAQVAVAAHPLSAGQTVSQSDVLLQGSDLSQLPPGVILDPALAIGKTVISGVSSGQAFRQDMLRSPQVIQQGQTVKLVAKGSGFQVSSEGKALANATLGQTVSVRTQSGQIINGIARQNGVVEVNF
ncbi:MAG: flagellar basal body P-ring formation chaperone FlgA [Sulfuricella sp.]|nr:flagellar basal body P-ring formation chaperone FlgA [Sulfuricella sp.]